MEDKISNYIKKTCPMCGENTNSVYENLCSKCGSFLEIKLDESKYKNDWNTYLKGLQDNKLVLNDILKYLFPPKIFNFTVYQTLNIMLTDAQKRLDFALKQINQFPDITPNEKYRQQLAQKLSELSKFIQQKQAIINQSLNGLQKTKINNPLAGLFQNYSTLWRKWKSLKEANEPIPEDLVVNIKTVLKEIEDFELDLKKGYPELKQNLIRLMEHLRDNEKTADKSLERTKTEYQTTMSVLKDMKDLTAKNLTNPKMHIEIKIYQINVLLNEEW